MNFQVSYKTYRRQLLTPLKMSRGVIDFREGVILRLESADGVSYGEVVILDYFRTETLDESLELLKSLPKQISINDLKNIPEKYPATRLGLESAILLQTDSRLNSQAREMKISKLLPAGEEALTVLENGLAEDFEIFKWKIGSYSLEVEFSILAQILEMIGDSRKLRLDANGGLSKAEAEKWLSRCEGTSVEFLEQPLAVIEFDAMLELAEKYSTPIALDESVAKTPELIRAHQQGWPGILVVKPSRLGDLSSFLDWREKTNAKIVYSSALETSIGTELGLRLAASDKNNNFGLGYGVAHWFPNDGLYLHPDEPTLKTGMLITEQYQSIWDRL